MGYKGGRIMTDELEVLDIRWFKSDKPTNKGVRLNMEEAKMLLDILRREIDG